MEKWSYPLRGKISLASFACVSIVIFYSALLCAQPTSPPVTAQDVIHGYLTTADFLHSYSMHIETKLTFEKTEDGFTGETYTGEVRIDNGRIDIIERRDDTKDNRTYPAFSYRWIWTGKQYQLRQQCLEGEGQNVLVVVSLKKENAEVVLQSASCGSFLNSVLYGDDVRVITLLKDLNNLSLQSQMENVGKYSCYVLSGKACSGNYKIWVDPYHGFNIRKAFVRKEANDIIFGSTVKNSPLSGSYQGLREVIVELKDVMIEEKEKFYIPVSAAMTVTSIDNEGKQTISSYVSKRFNIELKPDFERMRAFVMDGIPNGTSVWFADIPGTKYVWSDAEAVPQLTCSKEIPKSTFIQNNVVGKKAPSITTTDWLNNTCKDQVWPTGKVTVLEFWSIQCRPCVGLIPENNNLAKWLTSKGGAFLSVHSANEEPNNIKNFIKLHPIEYPVALDTPCGQTVFWSSQTFERYGIDALPSYVTIDKDGFVTSYGLPAKDYLQKLLENDSNVISFHKP